MAIVSRRTRKRRKPSVTPALRTDCTPHTVYSPLPGGFDSRWTHSFTAIYRRRLHPDEGADARRWAD